MKDFLISVIGTILLVLGAVYLYDLIIGLETENMLLMYLFLMPAIIFIKYRYPLSWIQCRNVNIFVPMFFMASEYANRSTHSEFWNLMIYIILILKWKEIINLGNEKV